MPSLRAVYEMTLNEYSLRVEGWKREQTRQLYRDRRTWYNTLIGPHYDPKKLPRTESAYFSIPEVDGQKPKAKDIMRERWKNAVEKYNKEKAKGDG